MSYEDCTKPVAILEVVRYNSKHADLAHLVEQHPRNVQVLSSSLRVGFIFLTLFVFLPIIRK